MFEGWWWKRLHSEALTELKTDIVQWADAACSSSVKTDVTDGDFCDTEEFTVFVSGGYNSMEASSKFHHILVFSQLL